VIYRNGCERNIRRKGSLSKRHHPSLLTSEHLLSWAEAQREPAVIGVRLTVPRGFGKRAPYLGMGLDYTVFVIPTPAQSPKRKSNIRDSKHNKVPAHSNVAQIAKAMTNAGHSGLGERVTSSLTIETCAWC
jgi:hypothetical protein